jgi:hypothetical protein
MEVCLTVVGSIGNGGIPGRVIWKTWYPVAVATGPQSRLTRSLPMIWETVTRHLNLGGARGVNALAVAVGLEVERVWEPSVPLKTA